MGLNKHDQVIRRHLAQKLEFLAKDLVALTTPTDEELQAYFTKHQDRYQEPVLYTFTQIFIDPDKRGDAVFGQLSKYKKDKPVSIEEMNDAIAKQVKKDFS
jgi:nitrate reductase assembly molybdenum cofactor insertion protein NarJ